MTLYSGGRCVLVFTLVRGLTRVLDIANALCSPAVRNKAPQYRSNPWTVPGRSRPIPALPIPTSGAQIDPARTSGEPLRPGHQRTSRHAPLDHDRSRGRGLAGPARAAGNGEASDILGLH